MTYVGIDIGGTNLKAGLVDDEGRILARESIKIATLTNQDALTEAMVTMTENLAKDAGVTMEDIGSVGVGVPGAVEIRGGTILYTCNLPLHNVPIRRLFHKYLRLPLYVENDANCAAVGEYYAGAGRDSKRFVTITLGTGVGGGIIHNGKIFHGANGMAGEVGHMTIVSGGEQCACGRKGCWEQYASASALKRMTRVAIEANPDSILARMVAENGGKVSGRSAFEAARAGDGVGQAVCDEYVGYLATGIANLVNIFQPDTLAIGGGVSHERDEQLLFPLRELVAGEVIPCINDKQTRIVKAELGNHAGIIGAALLGKCKRRR